MKSDILILDDDFALCKLLESILSEKYNVVVCGSPALAISVLKSTQNISCIITDLVLSGITGIDFLKYLKGSGNFNSIPVIVMSAYWQIADECYEAGACCFIRKPINPDILLEKLDDIVELGVI
ncbi:MAG: response regulator [Cyclobacteriaceae bacterium]|nr:response regulator [Cyclobacteriaceae bacterium]